ncbi:hypothetical protein [Primorskyibacter flagellatus]|uniref:hypothetical protein n=1 Tax=Primorskyibacter flagellatus TaxID=1387277 RepID=UPI003A8D5793
MLYSAILVIPSKSKARYGNCFAAANFLQAIPLEFSEPSRFFQSRLDRWHPDLGELPQMRCKVCLAKIPDSAVDRARIVLVAQALELPTTHPVLFALGPAFLRLASFPRTNEKQKECAGEPDSEAGRLLGCKKCPSK